MPEGPEIRRAADRIAAVIEGETARQVFFGLPRLASHGEQLTGRTVTRVETRGKAMLTWFDDAVAVYSHNQLYGRWMVRKTAGLPRTGRQLRFAVHTDRGAALLYSASEIAVLDPEDLPSHPYLRKLGPDPLHATTTALKLRRRLESAAFRRRRLAGLLLDQGFAAGLGNYLRSEILFVAGLHPFLRPMDLVEEERRALARAVNAITRRAYKTGGVTNDAASVKVLKKAGQPRRAYRHFVFSRSGRACRRCSDTVERVEMAGRRLYLCPTCQPPRPRP